MREEKPQETGFRIVLDENANRIARAFAQRLPNVVEKVTNGEFTAEVSGGVASIFATKVGGKMAASQKIEVTPMMQALLLEEAASEERWLIDLRDRGGRLGDELTAVHRRRDGCLGRASRSKLFRNSLWWTGLPSNYRRCAKARRLRCRSGHRSSRGLRVGSARRGPDSRHRQLPQRRRELQLLLIHAAIRGSGHDEGGPDPLTRIAPLLIWHLASNAYSAEPEQRARLEERDAAGCGRAGGRRTPSTIARCRGRSPLADYRVLATVHTGLYGRVLKCRREGTVCAVKETSSACVHRDAGRADAPSVPQSRRPGSRLAERRRDLRGTPVRRGHPAERPGPPRWHTGPRGAAPKDAGPAGRSADRLARRAHHPPGYPS